MLRREFRSFSNFAVAGALASLSSGCSTFHYFYQAGAGQLALINHAKPISEVLKDERVSPRIKTLLAEVALVKQYGESEGLKPTPNYTEYVQLDRPYAIYVVSAAEKLKFVSKTWSFPVVGNFPYLGWYDLTDARSFAHELSEQGWDVDVRGARAYSTLGWFRDAVLSSMIPGGKGEEADEALGDLVNVVIHESVHATLYIKGQSYFDESLAVYIAGVLTPEYLAKARGPQSLELKAYVDGEKRGAEREEIFHRAYVDLDKLYNSKLSDEKKLEEKSRILSELKTKTRAQREITNATLIQFKEYHSGDDDFTGLFNACSRDIRKFIGTLRALKEGSFQKQQQEDLAPVLKALTDAGCPQA